MNIESERSKPALMSIRREIVKIRSAIRWHRDQVGHERCWVDDDQTYRLLPRRAPFNLPLRADFAARCREYRNNRCNNEAPEIGAANDDSDLRQLTRAELEAEKTRLLEGVARHARILRSQRSWTHDKELYLLLPEKKLADWRLPDRSEFLENCDRYCAHCHRNPSEVLGAS